MITLLVLAAAVLVNSWAIYQCTRSQRKVVSRLVDSVFQSTESIHKKLDEMKIITLYEKNEKPHAANRKPRTPEQKLRASLDKKAYWDKKRAERATTPPAIPKELVR